MLSTAIQFASSFLAVSLVLSLSSSHESEHRSGSYLTSPGQEHDLDDFMPGRIPREAIEIIQQMDKLPSWISVHPESATPRVGAQEFRSILRDIFRHEPYEIMLAGMIYKGNSVHRKDVFDVMIRENIVNMILFNVPIRRQKHGPRDTFEGATIYLDENEKITPIYETTDFMGSYEFYAEFVTYQKRYGLRPKSKIRKLLG